MTKITFRQLMSILEAEKARPMPPSRSVTRTSALGMTCGQIRERLKKARSHDALSVCFDDGGLLSLEEFIVDEKRGEVIVTDQGIHDSFEETAQDVVRFITKNAEVGFRFVRQHLDGQRSVVSKIVLDVEMTDDGLGHGGTPRICMFCEDAEFA